MALSRALGLGWALFGLLNGLVILGYEIAKPGSMDMRRDFGDAWLLYGLMLPIFLAVGSGLQGFIAGIVVGVFFDRLTDIRIGISPRFILRHVAAFVGSAIGAGLLMGLLGWPPAGEWGPLACGICICWTFVWVDCIMVLGVVGVEEALVSGNWGIFVLAIVACLLVGLVPLAVDRTVGVLYWSWGAVYWTIFLVISVLLKKVMGWSTSG